MMKKGINIMNEKIKNLLSIIELRIVLQDSLEYIGRPSEAGFSKRIYESRSKSFFELIKDGSNISNFLEGLNEKREGEKISVGEFIQSQFEKCDEDIFGEKAIYLQEEYGAMKLKTDGLLESMHVLIETNLNLGLLIDAIVSELYQTNEFPEDISNYLSYNEAYFYSYAAQTVSYIFSDFFKKGVEGRNVEIQNENLSGKNSVAKKQGLAAVAFASVGIDSAIKMFSIIKSTYRIGDENFIKILDEVEGIIKPYDNEEIIKTNFEPNENIEELSNLFEDYTLLFKHQSKYMFNNIYLRYSN